MRRALGLILGGVLMSGLIIGGGVEQASALSLSADYFAIQSGHPDTQQPFTGLVIPNLVGLALGPTGLPVSNGGFVDVNGANELLWWTPGNRGSGKVVVADNIFAGGTTNHTTTDPFNLNFGSGFFVGKTPTCAPINTGGCNDSSAFRAVHWSGTFLAAIGGATFTIQSDDDAWLFIDGVRVVDDGGVKGIGATAQSGTVAAGIHTLNLFYADRHTIDAGIIMNCTATTGGGPGCLDVPVPEPATLLLFGTTLAGLGAVVRRRLYRNEKVAA